MGWSIFIWEKKRFFQNSSQEIILLEVEWYTWKKVLWIMSLWSMPSEKCQFPNVQFLIRLYSNFFSCSTRSPLSPIATAHCRLNYNLRKICLSSCFEPKHNPKRDWYWNHWLHKCVSLQIFQDYLTVCLIVGRRGSRCS